MYRAMCKCIEMKAILFRVVLLQIDIVMKTKNKIKNIN